GFLSALEIAPRLEVVSGSPPLRLAVEPVGEGPPYADFAFTLGEAAARERPSTGTSVRLCLSRPIAPAVLAGEIASVAGLVDPARARIFVDGVPINTVRVRMRTAARLPIGDGFGDLELLAGRGEGVAPRLSITQAGLLVIANLEPFGAP